MNQKTLEIFHNLHPSGKAFPYQEKWAQDDSKYKLAVKARQIGITTTEATKRFLECLFWESTGGMPRPPVIIFCSPSQRQSNRLMEYIQRVRRTMERKYGTQLSFKKEREDFIQFDNSSEIWSLPNNPRTIEGIDASDGIIDEFGNFEGKEDKEVYESMMGSLAARGGGMTMFGKPRGRRGLFWLFYDPFGEFASQFSIHKFDYHVRAEVDPIYEKTVLEQELRMTPLAFKEQYLCEFVDESFVVFPWELLDRQTRAHPEWTLHHEVRSDALCYMGIDFARREDETAVSLVEHLEEKTILRFQEVTNEKFDKQIEWIEKLINHFRPIKVLVDSTGLGLPLLDQLTKTFASRVEGIVFSNQVKEKLVLNTRNLFEEGRLEIPDNKELKDQLHGIEKTILDSGRIKYTGKRSETDWLDDRAWSLFLACIQLGEGDWSMLMADIKITKPLSDYEKWIRDLDDDGKPL